MITFEKSQLAKEIVTQLVLYKIISILKNILRWQQSNLSNSKYLSKQQSLDADPKVIQQIIFNGILDRAAEMLFIIEEAR